MGNWKTDVIDSEEGFLNCIDCIERVELTKDIEPAVPGKCVYHDKWVSESEETKTTCGNFSIHKRYYQDCESPSIQNKNSSTFEECTIDRNCSLTCVRNYLQSDKAKGQNCGNAEPGQRYCVDYGIMHAFSRERCFQQNDHVDLKHYIVRMNKTCGAFKRTEANPSKSEVKVEEIVVPVVVVTLVIVGIICAVIFVLRKRQKHLTLSNRDRYRNVYLGDAIGGSGMGVSYDYTLCSDEVQGMLEQRRILIEDLDLQEEIGRGHFGLVRKATLYLNSDHTESVLTAVKMLRSANVGEKDIDDMLREAYIMHQFNHINVLNLIGVVWQKGDPPLVVLPFMGKGSLLELVRKTELNFSESDLLNFAVQVSSGLEYLESCKFVHRDVALRNCLISDYYIVKISDFGLSRDIYDTGIYNCDDGSDKQFDIKEKRLPWKWLAPECINKGEFSHKSDVWAYGILCWELFSCGKQPYPAIANVTVLNDCLEAGYRLSKPDAMTKEVYEIIKMMWCSDSSTRPTFKEVQIEFKRILSSMETEISYSYIRHHGDSFTINFKGSPDGEPSYLDKTSQHSYYNED